MGGPNLQPQQQLSQAQQALMGQEVGASNAATSQMYSILNPLIATYQGQEQLQQPAIAFAQGLASGNPAQVAEAAGPQLSQISQQYAGAKQSILDTTPAGAAQDFAMMQLPQQQANQVASTLGGEVTQGMNTLLGLGQGAQGALGNIASGLGGFSMQELGAGLTASGQASQTNQSVMNAQAQQKATTMGFLGSLAGAAGGAAGGFLSNPNVFSSDRRLKKNIRSYKPETKLEKIAQIPVYEFDYISGPSRQVGVMAQDLLADFPEFVSVGPDGFYRVDYAALATMAIEAVRELRVN